MEEIRPIKIKESNGHTYVQITVIGEWGLEDKSVFSYNHLSEKVQVYTSYVTLEELENLMAVFQDQVYNIKRNE